MTGILHQQLPMVLAADERIVRLVSLVDRTATELYERVGQKDAILGLASAPEPMLEWWCDLLQVPLAHDVATDRRRAVLMAAAAHYGRRGTRSSLAGVLTALVAPGEPDAVTIDDDGWVGVIREARCTHERPPAPAAPTDRPQRQPVRIELRADRRVSRRDVVALVERELPANVRYVIEDRSPDRGREEDDR